jgi:hypothetical protein
MSTLLQVWCISKREHHNPHERITHIGGANPNSTPWKMTESAAIIGIESLTYSFYVSVNDKRVMVEVAERNGRKYLKTETDGYAPNNLLDLPECP